MFPSLVAQVLIAAAVASPAAAAAGDGTGWIRVETPWFHIFLIAKGFIFFLGFVREVSHNLLCLIMKCVHTL